LEAAAARKILQAATQAAAAQAAATVGQFRKKQKLGTASPLMSSPPSGGEIAKHFVRSHDVRSNAEFTVDNADIALEQPNRPPYDFKSVAGFLTTQWSIH
jgi:hypothetical protein